MLNQVAVDIDSQERIACQKELFAIPDGTHYLNCAYMSPMLRSTRSVINKWLDRMACPDFAADDFFEPANKARSLFAELINTDQPDRVAIIPSASYGIASAARNVTVRSSQNLIILADQFPSNYYAWKTISNETNAELRIVPRPDTTDNRGQKWNESILAGIDRNTAVIAVPNVHWTDGTRFDLEAIGKKARSVGAKLIIDGTQSIGALPFDQTRIKADAIICAGYKWLLAPYGVGIAYFADTFADGKPIEENWITRAGSENFSGLRYTNRFQPGAQRFDAGGRSNFVHINALVNSLEQLARWSPASIQDYCDRLFSPLTALMDHGFAIENRDYRGAHLFGIRIPSELDPVAVSNSLDGENIRTSVRGAAIRISPHVYNDVRDVESLATALLSLR